MTIIKKDDYVFSVDIEKTKKYYETHSLCDCAYCRNYYVQAHDKFPILNNFLDEFGVDISKPDEIQSIVMDNYIDYLRVDYTVCGTIKSLEKNEVRIYDNQSLSVFITDSYVSPNEQMEEYFTISVLKVQLPWVLNESF